MKKNKYNLNEELNRIKRLINFDIREHSHDVLSEQVALPKDIYKNYVVESTVANLPNIIQSYDPTKGAIKITDGNPWLATQRAISLRNFLIKNIQASLNIPFNEKKAIINETKVEGKGNDYQYVKATIIAKLEKPPVPQEPYEYNILYNFYEINGEPHILVTKSGLGSPKKVKENETFLKEYKKYLSKIPSETDAFIVTQTVGGGDVEGPNKGETLYGIMIPIKKGTYNAKNKNQLFFNGDNRNGFLNMGKFINAYTDEESFSQEQLKKIKPTQFDFTKTQGGGGDLGFGDLGSGKKGKLFKDNDTTGTDIVIKRMEGSKVGTLEGQPKEGEEGEWKTITEILYRNLFHDNFISIKKDTYKEIIEKIKEQIDNLGEKYKIVEISAIIQGFASEDNANNKCERGTTPDHSWGLTNPQNGPITTDKWVTLE